MTNLLSQKGKAMARTYRRQKTKKHKKNHLEHYFVPKKDSCNGWKKWLLDKTQRTHPGKSLDWILSKLKARYHADHDWGWNAPSSYRRFANKWLRTRNK